MIRPSEVIRQRYGHGPMPDDGAASAQLEWSLDISRFGGPYLHAADLNGDGETEFVVRQVAGGYQPAAPEWETLDCLTAFRRDGTVLWQHGDPWNQAVEFPCHISSSMWVGDIDGDGRAEAVVLSRAEGVLRVLEGATGLCRHQQKLRDRAFALGAFFPIPDGPGLLTLHASEMAADGYTRNPRTWFYDAQLRLVAGPMHPRFGGHGALAQIFVPSLGESVCVDGFTAWDRAGHKVWECRDAPVPEGHHVDSMAAATLENDGRALVVYCLDGPTENTMIGVDAFTGQFLWRVESRHPQHVVVAAKRGMGGACVFLGEKATRIGGYDQHGAPVWREDHLAAYPLLVTGCSGVEYILWRPHRMAELAPLATDKEGRIVVVFKELQNFDWDSLLIPEPDTYGVTGKEQLECWRLRLGDWGVGFGVVTSHAADGSGRVYVYTRKRLWGFQLP